jgi:hypothetical protein
MTGIDPIDKTPSVNPVNRTHAKDSLLPRGMDFFSQFHYRHTTFSTQLKSKCVTDILSKAAALRITLNIDGTPIGSRAVEQISYT